MNHSSRGALANEDQSWAVAAWPLCTVLRSFCLGLASSPALPAAWSENCRRRTGITQKVVFVPETTPLEPPLCQQELIADDSGGDEGKWELTFITRLWIRLE